MQKEKPFCSQIFSVLGWRQKQTKSKIFVSLTEANKNKNLLCCLCGENMLICIVAAEADDITILLLFGIGK